jgi:hypothetical protein
VFSKAEEGEHYEKTTEVSGWGPAMCNFIGGQWCVTPAESCVTQPSALGGDNRRSNAML